MKIPRVVANIVLASGIACTLAPMARAQGPGFALFDTQVHFYSSDFAKFPLHAEHAYMGEATMTARARDQPNDIAHVTKEWQDNGVGAGVGIQYGAAYLADNRYLLSVAAQNKATVVPVVIVNPDAPNAAQTLSDLVKNDSVVGFRKLGNRAPDGSYPWLTTAGMLGLWQVANEQALVVELMPYPRSPDPRFLEDIGRLADRFPKTRIVLDHCAWPAPLGEPSYGIDDSYAALAQHRNVYLKFTTENVERLKSEMDRVQGFVERLVKVFGADHVMWGSDMGNTMLPYSTMVGDALTATQHLRPGDRKQVLDLTGREVYSASR
jgi:L-fuconolactonase